jgi:hypothetical protein
MQVVLHFLAAHWQPVAGALVFQRSSVRWLEALHQVELGGCAFVVVVIVADHVGRIVSSANKPVGVVPLSVRFSRVVELLNEDLFKGDHSVDSFSIRFHFVVPILIH